MFQCPKEGNHDVFILLQVTLIAFRVDLFENNCCILVQQVPVDRLVIIGVCLVEHVWYLAGNDANIRI